MSSGARSVWCDPFFEKGTAIRQGSRYPFRASLCGVEFATELQNRSGFRAVLVVDDEADGGLLDSAVEGAGVHRPGDL